MTQAATKDLTLADAAKALDAFRAKLPLGPRGSFYVILSKGGDMQAPCYLNDVVGGLSFSVSAKSFRELIAGLEAKWADYSEAYRQRVIRNMALEIIRITAELGSCSDAALRGSGKFRAEEIVQFGEAACEDAGQIASNGPFTIMRLGAANEQVAA